MKFETKSLSQCLSLVIDRRGVTPKKLGSDWADTGYRVLSANNVKSSGLQKTDEIRYVNKTTYQKWMHTEIQRDDILLTSEAPAGEVYVWDSDEKIVVGQRLYALRVKEDVNPWFLAFYLQSPKGKAEIKNKCSGSTVFGISAKTFDSIEIVLPDKTIQDHIADVLHNINSKIEINNALSSKLEDFTRMVYDYWFLQFEFPNEEGKPYKSSGGKMVWNEELKREIPEGWNTTTIGDITINHDSERIPLASKERSSIQGRIPYYGATGIMGYVNRAIFKGDYVLLAEDGSVMDENGYPIIQRISGETWVNNHAHVLEPANGYHCRLLMMILKRVPVVLIKTGSIQMKINQENMNKYHVLNIPDKLKNKANSIFDNIDAELLRINNETQQLTSLRDFLLPLLMNGQVTFKDEATSEEE